MALHGLPALRYLTTTDREERLMLLAIAKRADQLAELHRHNLAVEIVNLYVKVRRRG